MVPTGPYLELFGRVHNQREFWTTVGNESIAFLPKPKKDKQPILGKKKIKPQSEGKIRQDEIYDMLVEQSETWYVPATPKSGSTWSPNTA